MFSDGFRTTQSCAVPSALLATSRFRFHHLAGIVGKCLWRTKVMKTWLVHVSDELEDARQCRQRTSDKCLPWKRQKSKPKPPATSGGNVTNPCLKKALHHWEPILRSEHCILPVKAHCLMFAISLWRDPDEDHCAASQAKRQRTPGADWEDEIGNVMLLQTVYPAHPGTRSSSLHPS